MTAQTFVYPFYQEDHLRRGRTVFRPVVRFSIGAVRPIVDALVDTGCEPVLADSSLALIAGIDLSNPIDVERIGIAGGSSKPASSRSFFGQVFLRRWDAQ
jgi:hypothetical protein